MGVATCYRLYRPQRPTRFGTLLRAVWNASVLSLLGEGSTNFAWGGGMAVRRETFESIGVRDAWRGALSDDYALTHAVRRAGLRVAFRADSLVPSYGDIRIVPLMSWVTRQIKITRVYWPALFALAAVSHTLYSGFLIAGLLTAIQGSRLAAVLLASVLSLSAANGAIRARALGFERHRWAYAVLAPVSSLLTLQAVVRAFFSRRIEWRGRVYEMRSPHETVIVKSSVP